MPYPTTSVYFQTQTSLNYLVHISFIKPTYSATLNTYIRQGHIKVTRKSGCSQTLAKNKVKEESRLALVYDFPHQLEYNSTCLPWELDKVRSNPHEYKRAISGAITEVQ